MPYTLYSYICLTMGHTIEGPTIANCHVQRRAVSTQNHKVHVTHWPLHYSVIEEKMFGSTSVLFFVIAAVFLYPKVGGQPGIGGDKGVAEYSSPESQPTACIRSLVDLRQAYFGLKTAPGSIPKESTIFSFYPSDVVMYTSLALFYEWSTINVTNQPASSSPNSEDCCNPESTSSCKVFFRHRSHLYKALCPPLFFLYAFPKSPNHVWKLKGYNRKLNKYMMKKLCWKVPPFCRNNGPALLEDFTAEVNAHKSAISCMHMWAHTCMHIIHTSTCTHNAHIHACMHPCNIITLHRNAHLHAWPCVYAMLCTCWINAICSNNMFYH